jgi:hypothetical protein
MRKKSRLVPMVSWASAFWAGLGGFDAIGTYWRFVNGKHTGRCGKTPWFIHLNDHFPE